MMAESPILEEARGCERSMLNEKSLRDGFYDYARRRMLTYMIHVRQYSFIINHAQGEDQLRVYAGR